MFKKICIRSYEIGLQFRDGEFVGLINPGKRWFFTRFGKTRVRVVSKRDPELADEQLDVIVKSGALEGQAEVIDLKDHERALVWIDGRFSRVLGPGLYVYWTGVRDVRVETVTIENARNAARPLRWNTQLRAISVKRWMRIQCCIRTSASEFGRS